MRREYLRVTPTSARLDPDVVSTAIASLHKLSATDSDGVITRLTPFRSEQPVTFEFLAISKGPNEPVEFYYSADAKLDVLRQRLRSIYPDSFDIDRVDVDIALREGPAEYSCRCPARQVIAFRLHHVDHSWIDLLSRVCPTAEDLEIRSALYPNLSFSNGSRNLTSSRVVHADERETKWIDGVWLVSHWLVARSILLRSGF